MPPSFVEEAGISVTSAPSTSARDLEPASKPAARSRQATRKQQSTAWKQQTSGGTVTGLAGIALVVCGYFGWRWYQRWKENSHTTRGSGDASTSQPAGSKKKASSSAGPDQSRTRKHFVSDAANQRPAARPNTRCSAPKQYLHVLENSVSARSYVMCVPDVCADEARG